MEGFEVRSTVEQIENAVERRAKVWIEKFWHTAETDDRKTVDEIFNAFFDVTADGSVVYTQSTQGIDFPLPPGITVTELNYRHTDQPLPDDIEVLGNAYVNGAPPSVIAQVERLKIMGNIHGEIDYSS